MRIQHNIMAMNAYRNFTNNTSALAKNLEKLSSGYKINRAGDDAAGLAISEKMRAQITGLETAQKNAKDGISLVQTAEGALTEVHDMLNRMVELATQSANGTYDNETDRAQMQKEIAQLQSEIDRIADSANFNGIKLLDGSLDSVMPEATATQLMDIAVNPGAGPATSAKRVDAQAAEHVFNAEDSGGIVFDNSKADALQITFKGKDGKEKTITLVESSKNSVMASSGAALAEALAGNGKLGITAAAGTSEEDIAEFRDLFEITGSASAATGSKHGISIKAKDATSGAELVSIKHAQDTDGTAPGTAVENLAKAATIAQDANSKSAEPAGYAVDFNTADAAGTSDTIVANTTLKIGDTVYEFVGASGDKPKTAGATAITKGSSDKTTVENLVAQLKKDGYDVQVSANDKSKIIFTDMSQLQEKQGGAQIEASSDNVLLTKQEAGKQTTEITFGGGGSGQQTLTFNYVDADGKAQTKTLNYTPTVGSNAGSATGIYNALKNDAELVSLFDISDNTSGKLTIKARGTGDGAGVFTGMTSSDAAASQTVTQTVGAYEGKTLELADNLKAGDTITIDGKTYEFSNDSSAEVGKGNIRISLGASANDTIKNLSAQLEKDGVKHTYDQINNKLIFNDKDVAEVSDGLTLQIGDTSDSYNQLKVSIKDMHVKSLGIADIDIGNQLGAQEAVELIKGAINKVSDVRGTLGATQNRLDHTINNLSVMQENIQDAEATIRDTDVAAEMMSYTKNNILIQSAQAMLAQANQVPQGVLQLLQ